MSTTELPLMLGRQPAMRPAALSDLAVYATEKLPPPPAKSAVPNTPYPIDGNDKYGDCTMAGVAHLIAAWNVDFDQRQAVPDEDEVVKEYFTLTDKKDTGLVEANVLKRWHTDGLFGEKIAGYAPVNAKDTLEIHQAIAFYGGCYLGIECPRSAQEQFRENKPWTYVEGSPVEGGHCIVALGYDEHGVECATWGGVALVTYPFLAHYLDEAWVILSQQLVDEKQDKLGISLATLQADLKKV
ncbi:MAG TPA: hypothetical protein VKV16_02970 [Solirubrobacteraceae bacterium]|nr:hypothetical protein [Solirubrobacteraceae bacterium]